jgi:hypothetical protein
MAEVLRFIGGPLDGQKRWVENPSRYCEVDILETNPCFWQYAKPEDPLPTIEVRTFTYQKELVDLPWWPGHTMRKRIEVMIPADGIERAKVLEDIKTWTAERNPL